MKDGMHECDVIKEYQLESDQIEKNKHGMFESDVDQQTDT